VIWDGGGGDGNWTTAANWDGDVAPVANDLLQFGGATNLLTNNDTAADTPYSGIDFLNTAGSFTLGGNSLILLGNINQDSNNAQSISLPVVLDASTVTVGGTGTGGLSFGQVAYGITPAAGVATLNTSALTLNRSVPMSSLLVRTNNSTAPPANNTMTIGAGQTLTVNGEVTVGLPNVYSVGLTVQTHLTASGGGNLVVNSGANLFRVGLGRNNTATGNDPFSTLDLSGLANFTFTGTNHFRVGNGNSRGEMNLAGTSNTITASQVRIGDTGQDGGGTGGSENNNGGDGFLRLGGGTNVINADVIQVGRTKGAGFITFQGATGTLTIAGTAGGASTANIQVGSADNGTGDTSVSELQFAGHNVNVQAGNVVIGQMTANGVQSGKGAVTFDTGTFSANSIRMGVNSGTGVSAAHPAQGSFTLGGTGVLNVANQFLLAQRTTATAGGSISSGTFTINGGTANINTDILDASTTVSTLGPNTTTVTLAGGTLNIMGNDIGSRTAPLTTVNLTSGSLSNAALIAGNTISLGAAVNITGTPTYLLTDASTLTSGLATLNLVSGGGIEGGGATGATVSGNVVAQSGSQITVGLSAVASSLTFNNDLSLNNGSTLNLDLSDTPGAGLNDQINVGGNLSVAGTVNVNIGSLATAATVGQTYTLINYTGSLTGNQTNFAVGAAATRKTFTVVDTGTTPNAINVLVGGSNPFALTWIGNVNNEWDLIGDANWNSGGPQQFFNQDNVTFNDTSTNLNAVQLVGSLKPGSVTVDATRNYTFAGTGSIDGGATLTKQGTGMLTVTNANNFTGGTLINAGVVEIGNGGSLGSGAVTNSDTLRINRTDDSTFANVVSGAGNVSYTGTGTTTVSGANTYTGTTTISAGTVTATNSGSLGDATGGAVTISDGAALNVGGNPTANNTNFGAKQFMIAGTGVGGTGVLTNSNATVAQQNAFQQVTLTADATVGGPGRFDIRGGTPTLNLQNHTLTKTGANQFTLVGVTVDDGNIVVNEGTLALENTTSIPDNATGTKLTFNDGTRLGFFNGAATSNNIARPMQFNGGVEVRNADDVAVAFASPVTLNGSATYTFVNDPDNSVITQNGVISETGGPRGIEVKTLNAANGLTLTADNTFTGSVAISGPGTLNISPTSTTPYLGNTANVSVGGTSLLGLNFNGTDTIGALLINGLSVAPGEWGPVGSLAPNQSDRLTGTGTLTVTAKILPGDFNSDGKVDAADYVTWRKNQGTFAIMANDAYFGTKIDQDQYNLWRANFGNTGPGSGAGLSGAVPEPGAILLAWCAMFGAVLLRSRGVR
jgi:autotransporter-associated beta strand protein